MMIRSRKFGLFGCLGVDAVHCDTRGADGPCLKGKGTLKVVVR